MKNDKTCSLLIPISVRAELAGKMPEKSIYSDFSYDFTQIGDPYAVIEKPLFSETKRQPGVYLHWSLPDCFAHGSQNMDTGEINYRLVPNRWSIIRMWSTYESGPVNAKAFFVESDRLAREPSAENKGSPSWPYTEDVTQPYRFLGRSIPMEQAASETEHGLPGQADEHIRLTAVSPVTPFFAAYAPLCRNVFSFYDDIPADGLTHISLCYMLCGWYHEYGEAEPFSEIQTLEQLREEFGLTANLSNWPERTICHGLTDCICWETADTYYHSGIPNDPEPGEIVTSPVLGVGNNTSEALAALMTAGENDGSERLLEFFFKDLHRDLNRRQGLIKAETGLHHTKFGAEPAFSITGLKKTTDSGTDVSLAPPSTVFMERLALLRSGQRKYQQEYASLLQAQRKAYENWYVHLYSDAPYDGIYAIDLLLSLQDIKVREKRLENMAGELDAAKSTLTPDKGYELFQEKDEPFYRPTDPSLVISQPAWCGAEIRHDSREPLFCRTDKQIVTRLVLSGIDGQIVELDGKDLCPNLPAAAIPTVIRDTFLALAAEAILLSNSFSGFLAQTAFSKAGLTPTAGDLERHIQVITSAQNCGRHEHPCFKGILPDSTALRRYHPRWYPLILEWEADYYPDMELLDSHPDFKRWTFLDGDYVYNGQGDPDPVINPDNAYPVRGRLYISDNASREVDSLVSAGFSKRTDIKKAVRSISRLSQALDGFNSSLIMRENTLPPALFIQDETEKKVLKLLLEQKSSDLGDRPLYDRLFSPFRAGFLSLSRVRIIDALGRFQDIPYPDVYAGEGMRAPGSSNPVRYLMLPPRIVQPARLATWFLSAHSEMADAEAFFTETSTPVCGFLLPNRLDHSIVVYTEKGIPAGSLNLVETGTGVRWESPPGQPHSTELPKDLDKELQGFLTNLTAAGPKALQGLVEYINSIQYYIQSDAHAVSEVEFIGKPLALARISLSLELLGETEYYRHYKGEENPDRTSLADITAASVPVWIGELKSPADGTAGFFEDGDYGRLHVYPGFAGDTADPYFIQNNQITLQPGPKAAPKILTLLFDPWTEISLITGILPVRSLQAPRDLVAEALDNISVTFFCSPILTGIQKTAVPIPHLDHADFFWLSASSQGGWTQSPLQYEDSVDADLAGTITAADGYILIQNKEEGGSQ